MAKPSHKRETNARLFIRLPKTPRASVVAGPLAVLATASAVSLGVLGAGVGVTSAAPLDEGLTAASIGPTAGDSTPAALDLAGDGDRRVISRGGGRSDDVADVDAQTRAVRAKPAKVSVVDRLLAPAAVREAIRQAEVVQFTTTDLNLWTAPGDQAEQTGVLDSGTKVTLTGRSLYGREEILQGRSETRWVTSGYFLDEKPEPAPTLGGSCTNGTTVPSGVSPNIVAVHQAVCANFPSITTYGTLRSDGEHAQGIAVDIMLGTDIGYQVADFIRANAAALGVNYVIYYQRIWSVERNAEGWRGMEDRGSVTQNHQDHVHVTTY